MNHRHAAIAFPSLPATSLILAALLLVTVPGYLFAEVQPSTMARSVRADPDILKGIDRMYERRFDDAEKVFSKVIAERPGQAAGYFYLAMVSWSRLAAGFWSADVEEEFEERIDRAVEVAERNIDNGQGDSYDFFYLGGALGFKGRYELMKDNWFASFFLAKDAVDALKTCIQMDPDNKDVLFGIGTFDYYTARFSGIKKFLAYLLLHEGNRAEGLRKLTIASKEALYSATESKSMLLHIYLFFEEEFRKALDLATQLAQQYPQNPRFKALEGVAYVRLGMERGVKQTVAGLHRKGSEASSPKEGAVWDRQALYLESIHSLFQGRCPEARELLQRILDQRDPETDPAMIGWPLMKIGMSYDIDGHREEAVAYYRQVLELENGGGAQVLAERFLSSPPAKGDPFLGY